MFDLLHMDLRRLVRDRAFYIILAVFAGVLIFACAMMAITANSDLLEKLATRGGTVNITISEQREMLQDAADSKLLLAQTNQASFFYSMFCSGGGLSVFIVILSTLFVCEDFGSGFAKNIFSIHRRGISYVLSKSLAMVGAVTGFLVVGTLLTQLSAWLFGMPLAASSLADFAKYFFQAWLAISAFAVQNVFFSILTRNIALSMVLSFVCAGGLVALLLDSIASLFRLHVIQFTLAGVVNEANGLNVFSVTVCLVWIGLYLLLGTWALRRRDI